MATPNSNSNIVSDVELKTIMNSIELQTMKTVEIGLQSGMLANPIELLKPNPNTEKLNNSMNNLSNILGSGIKEFETKVGRQMTYSEIRCMFG